MKVSMDIKEQADCILAGLIEYSDSQYINFPILEEFPILSFSPAPLKLKPMPILRLKRTDIGWDVIEIPQHFNLDVLKVLGFKDENGALRLSLENLDTSVRSC